MSLALENLNKWHPPKLPHSFFPARHAYVMPSAAAWYVYCRTFNWTSTCFVALLYKAYLLLVWTVWLAWAYLGIVVVRFGRTIWWRFRGFVRRGTVGIWLVWFGRVVGRGGLWSVRRVRWFVGFGFIPPRQFRYLDSYLHSTSSSRLMMLGSKSTRLFGRAKLG